MMRVLILPALLILLNCASCSAPASSGEAERVLFVGNSVTYYGNVPAVFSALAEASGRPVVSDMIVEAGAALAQRVADGSVARALDERRYTALVLQERGGALIGAFGPDAEIQSQEAIMSLAELAREKGVQAVLMGTYQRNPDVSGGLIEAESAAAEKAGIPYIEVSGKLQRLLEAAPELTWIAEDGVHPGKHLTLLDAILVHQALLGSLPDPEAITIRAPIYGSNTGLTRMLRQSDAPPPHEDTPNEVHYSAETMKKLIEVVDDESGR